MIEQNSNQHNNMLQDTLALNENDADKKSVGKIPTFVSYLSNTKNRLRRFFIQKNEKSLVVMLLEQMYYRFLSCKIRVLATFFLSFSAVALVLGGMLNTSISDYISSKSTFDSIIIAIIGLILFTSNKTVEEQIVSSKFLSPLNIVYTQPGITSSNFESGSFNAFSTAFFVGVICGIVSIIFPAASIIAFIVSMIYTLFIFNRPECGILMVALVLPFLSEFYVIAFSFIAFFALIYKYLLGKRHINISTAEILSVIAVLYIAVRAASSDFASINAVSVMSYVLFFVVFVTTANLIRSTSMYRRTLAIIVILSRFYTLMLVVYYLLSVIFGADSIQVIISKCGLDEILYAIIGHGFVAPILAVSVPLNLSFALCGLRKSELVKEICYVVVMFACTVLVASFSYILLILISCVIVLFFYKKRFAFLLPALFPLSYGIIKLVDMIPPRYVMSFVSTQSHGWELFLSSFKQSAVFGRGFERSERIINNTSLNIVNEFGIVGSVLISAVIIFALIKTVRALVLKRYLANKVRMLAIGQIASCVSFVCCCSVINSLTDIRMIFLFSVVFSLAYSSVRCYEADYIDEFTVREYLNS